MHQLSSFFLRGSLLFLGMSIGGLAPASHLRAEIVLSQFEEAELVAQVDQTNKVYTGQAGAASSFQSGKVAFANDGVYVDGQYTFWSGIGYSQKTAMADGEFWDSGNDMIAKPGVGAGPGGSATWGVIYQLGTLTAEQGYVFDSLAITNTLWTWTTMVTEDPYIPANTPFSDGDFFAVKFTNTATSDSMEVALADFRGPTQEHFILDDWLDVDLSGLNASKLSVSFLGSRNSQWGLVTPAYAAIDNVAVSAVPEPSSLALMAAAGSAGMWFRWRKRRPSARVKSSPEDIV